MSLLLSQVGAPPAAEEPAFTGAAFTVVYGERDPDAPSDEGFVAGPLADDLLPDEPAPSASNTTLFDDPPPPLDVELGFESAGISEPDELPTSSATATVAFEHFEDARQGDEGFVAGPLEEVLGDPLVTSVASTTIFTVEYEPYEDGEGWERGPLADDVVTPPAPGGGGGGGGGVVVDRVPFDTPLKYVRVRAVDWNGNLGNWSPFLNLRTGLATSAHIGFQAVSAIVRSEFIGTYPDYTIDPGSILYDMNVGHTPINTLGGTVLVDCEVECEWETFGVNGVLRVSLLVDGEVVDEASYLPFPCDTGVFGYAQRCVNVITGIGLPAQIDAGAHTFWFRVESIGDVNHLYVQVTRIRMALLEMRR